MDVVTIFDTVSGHRLGRLPAQSWKWSRKVSRSGALEVTVRLTQDIVGLDLRERTRPWRTVLAVVSGNRILAAGPIYKRSWDADSEELSISCGDCLDLLKRRLVLPVAQRNYPGGEIQGSDGKWPLGWSINLTGTLSDIAASLVRISLIHGRLPIVLPSPVGGSNERNYHGPDLATVASRLQDLSEVISGPEFLFQPRLVNGGDRMEWHMLIGDPELMLAEHTWDARNRRHPMVKLSVEEDASDMVSDAWERGGNQEDLTVLGRYHDPWLEEAGWPLLQSAGTSHSSASELTTLTAYAKAATVQRSHSTEVVSLKVRRIDEGGYLLGDTVTPGDHVLLRMADPYMGNNILGLKVQETSGDKGEWITCACRELIDPDI